MRLHALWVVAASLFGLATALTVTGAWGDSGRPFGSGRPVIGRPSTLPSPPLAGARLVVTFRVRRSDTGKPLAGGKMICDPSLAGSVIPHSESFRAGVATLSFVVPVEAEGGTLTVRLTIKANGHAAQRTATLPIPPLPKPSLTIADASVEEGNAGTTTLSLPLTLSGAGPREVSVDYATADGSAIAGSDYQATSGTLNFAPGETAKTIAITILGDIASEQDETFTVTLANPHNATLATSTATGTILDDELVLVSPARDAVIPQNDPATGCPANPTRGYGHSISFAWRTNQRPDIAAFRLRVQHTAARYPIEDVTLGAGSTDYTHRGCNAYVADVYLAGWQWSVTALDKQGTPLAWKQGTFSFAPCRLGDGTGCS